MPKYLGKLRLLMDAPDNAMIEVEHPAGTAIMFRDSDIIGLVEYTHDTIEWNKEHDKFASKESDY
jgi:hypothetical protein